MSRRYSFDQLENADLVVDAIYDWGPGISFAFEPLHKLLGVRNTGGFRPLKVKGGDIGEYAYVVLYSTGTKEEWPDTMNPDLGLFTYYGDNKKITEDWQNTPGNKILDNVFRNKKNTEDRTRLYPFFFFTTVPDQSHVQFRGVAIPGHQSKNADEELIVVDTKTAEGTFHNYMGVFSLLDISIVTRTFIEDLQSGLFLSENAPEEWRNWVENKEYRLLPPLQIKPRKRKFSPAKEEVERLEPLSEAAVINRIRELDNSSPEEPIIKEYTSKQYARITELARRVREHRGDKCQICSDEFASDKGAYCDTHHVNPLKDEGRDTSDNIIVVCPNCHRKFHLTDVELIDRGVSKSVKVPWRVNSQEIEYWRNVPE